MERRPAIRGDVCSRARLSSDVSEIKLVFRIPPERPTPNFPPSWNVAPTGSLPIVRFNPKDRQRSLDVMRWAWSPTRPKTSRSVSPTSTPRPRASRRGRLSARRSSAGAAWCRSTIFTESGKQPYAIALADRSLMALAGLWENWHSPAGEWVRSFAIVTTTPNELCADIHDRMPVILKPEAWPAWLGEQPADLPQLKSLLAPYPTEDMIAWPVSTRVGNVKNNDPSLIEPIVLR
jgi:putative SOS response-associated peptidase YedK